MSGLSSPSKRAGSWRFPQSVVREVRGQSASQMPLADNDDVVQTLAPDRADKPFRKRVPPGLRAAVRTSSVDRNF
jgi:hypothetical protein